MKMLVVKSKEIINKQNKAACSLSLLLTLPDCWSFDYKMIRKNRLSTLSLMFSHSMSSATSQLNSTFGSSACGHSTSIRYWLLSWLVAKIQSINLLAQTRKCKLKNREIRNIYGISFVYFSVWLLLITPREIKTSLTIRQDIDIEMFYFNTNKQHFQ